MALYTGVTPKGMAVARWSRGGVVEISPLSLDVWYWWLLRLLRLLGSCGKGLVSRQMSVRFVLNGNRLWSVVEVRDALFSSKNCKPAINVGFKSSPYPFCSLMFT